MPKLHPAAVDAYYEALEERDEQRELDEFIAEQVLIDSELTFEYDERHDFIDELDALGPNSDSLYDPYYDDLMYRLDLIDLL